MVKRQCQVFSGFLDIGRVLYLRLVALRIAGSALIIVNTRLKSGGLAKIGGESLELALGTLNIGSSPHTALYQYSNFRNLDFEATILFCSYLRNQLDKACRSVCHFVHRVLINFQLLQQHFGLSAIFCHIAVPTRIPGQRCNANGEDGWTDTYATAIIQAFTPECLTISSTKSLKHTQRGYREMGCSFRYLRAPHLVMVSAPLLWHIGINAGLRAIQHVLWHSSFYLRQKICDCAVPGVAQIILPHTINLPSVPGFPCDFAVNHVQDNLRYACLWRNSR